MVKTLLARPYLLSLNVLALAEEGRDALEPEDSVIIGGYSHPPMVSVRAGPWVV